MLVWENVRYIAGNFVNFHNPRLYRNLINNFHYKRVFRVVAIQKKFVNAFSPGYNLITPEMIKNLPNVAFETLVKLFNATLKVGHYPTSWVF